jgi:hypothetical protein
MAVKLTQYRAQLLHRDRNAVRALLGRPLTVRRWTTTTPAPRTGVAELIEFRARTLDEIWVYPGGRVQFSLAGGVLKVDDKRDPTIPPVTTVA